MMPEATMCYFSIFFLLSSTDETIAELLLKQLLVNHAFQSYMRVLMPVNWDLGLALKNSWELGLLSQN